MHYLICCHRTRTEHPSLFECRPIRYTDQQWRIQKFLKGGGAEDNLSSPSSFIANAHNEIYAFYTKNGCLEKI